MNDRERLILLLRDMDAHPEKTCPRFLSKDDCDGCVYDAGATCDDVAKRADYLITNGVTFAPKLTIAKVGGGGDGADV